MKHIKYHQVRRKKKLRGNLSIEENFENMLNTLFVSAPLKMVTRPKSTP